MDEYRFLVDLAIFASLFAVIALAIAIDACLHRRKIRAEIQKRKADSQRYQQNSRY